MNELDELKKNAGITESNVHAGSEVMVPDFGGLPLERVVRMIQEDAAKLDPNNIRKEDVLFIRNGAAGIASLFNKPSLFDDK